MNATRPLACIRLACTLSAGACAARYRGAQGAFPLPALIVCKTCPAGERLQALLPRPYGPERVRDAKSCMRDILSVPPPPRNLGPF